MDISTYKNRRGELMKALGKGLILLSSNHHLPRNYKGNPLPFRQDSNFLYFTGINMPALYCLLDCDSGREYLAGDEPTVEDAIWSGPQKCLKDHAAAGAILEVMSPGQLSENLKKAGQQKRGLHYLPPYTAERKMALKRLLEISAEEIEGRASVELIKAVIALRSVKTDEEVAEIEDALDGTTGPMHIMAMKMAKEGIHEYEIVAEMYRIAKAKNLDFAYQVICSVRGETLHNEDHHNVLKRNQLLLVDAGTESRNHYAADITRTTPVGGKFSARQREIYDIVLKTQQESIKMIRSGIKYRDVHIAASGIIADGLKQIGIMKGNTEEAVNAGAHALFFPHGLGHMLGLDVHDMEDLGENYVGYSDTIKRSSQFGTAYLRLAKELREGYVLTVEPGIYFIPVLIELWKKEKRFKEFINYELIKGYYDFGGIRIEDNILVTKTGYRILGKPIPKHPDEIEKLTS
jgi:Xaa-Pro aminopeptidase